MTGAEIMAAAGLLASFILGWFTIRNAVRANKTTEKKVTVEEKQAQFGANLELNKYIDGRVDALVEERIGDVRQELADLKASDRLRTSAMTRILRAIAGQWPQGHPGPILDPADIAAVEETIPSQWLRPQP